MVKCISTNPECRSDHRWLVYNHSLVLIAFLGSESSRQVRRQSVLTNFRAAYCNCFASCHCYHDQFIVRGALTSPPFTGFTQFALPSRCSRSTLTTVCFCARDTVFKSGLCVQVGSLCSYRVSVFISGLQLHYQIHHKLRQRSSCGGVWDPWSVENQSCIFALLLLY